VASPPPSPPLTIPCRNATVSRIGTVDCVEFIRKSDRYDCEKMV